ncbi:universal stress protein [Schlesneria paludicola]|uniref:universal stress protein n=1 Tax=Schlesneria paludicola TaxID=360056 RepID=UPI000299EC88|nr:universal stress protein [Schlesneria paludicola]
MKLYRKRQNSTNPYWDVRPAVGETGRAKRVLLEIDGSPYSKNIVTHISLRPWPVQSEIRLIMVIHPIEATALVAHAVLDELINIQHIEAVRTLNAASDVFKQNSLGLRSSMVVRTGFPKDVILDEAHRWNADLVIVGSRGMRRHVLNRSLDSQIEVCDLKRSGWLFGSIREFCGFDII